MEHRCQMAPKIMCNAKGTLNVGYYAPMVEPGSAVEGSGK